MVISLIFIPLTKALLRNTSRGVTFLGNKNKNKLRSMLVCCSSPNEEDQMDETETGAHNHHPSFQWKPKPVLCVGNAVVDCINVVDHFPLEDSEQCGRDYYWQRGGNATNNCTVLSLLNTPCEFVGVLPSEGAEAKDCPELTHGEFKDNLQGDFQAYSWIHFELRFKTEEVVGMIRDVVTFNKRQSEMDGASVILSVEVESPDATNPELAMCEVDFVFMSKDFAKSRKCQNMNQALNNLYRHCRPGCVLVCPWGNQGAGAKCSDVILESPARQDVRVVDTLGAGDTFNAAFISAVLHNSHDQGVMPKDLFPSSRSGSNGNDTVLKSSLDFACQVAGYKCGIYGYKGLELFAWR